MQDLAGYVYILSNLSRCDVLQADILVVGRPPGSSWHLLVGAARTYVTDSPASVYPESPGASHTPTQVGFVSVIV